MKPSRFERNDSDFDSVLGSLWCGSLVIILIWLLVITIVFGLILGDIHESLGEVKEDLRNLKGDVAETGQCCADVSGVIEGFRPCLDEYCDTDNFPRLFGAIVCKGCWDADANVPPLASGVGRNGDLYYVCVPGDTDLEGVTDWTGGDTLKFIQSTPTGPRWVKNDGSTPFDALEDAGPGLSLITGDTSLRKLIPAGLIDITDVGGTGYEVSNAVTLHSLGGSPPDTAGIVRILDNPGSSGDFSFRSLKAGPGMRFLSAGGNVQISVNLVTRKSVTTTTFLEGDNFDAIRDDDIKTGDVVYSRAVTFCNPLSELRLNCYCDLDCIGASGTPVSCQQSNLYTALTDAGISDFRVPGLSNGCICRYGYIRVRSSPQFVRLRASVACLA